MSSVGDPSGEHRALQASAGHWRRPPLIQDARWRWGISGAVVLYLIVAWLSVDVNWARVAQGMDRAADFVGSFLRPDFISRSDEIFTGLLESLTMTLAATVIGVILAIPIGLGAARNLAPLPVYLLCRGIIPGNYYRHPVRHHVRFRAPGRRYDAGVCHHWFYGKVTCG